MADRQIPDLSHLSGDQIRSIAEALSTGPIKALMAHKKEILEISKDDVGKLVDIAKASAAHCGGFGCG
jgi:hypothetical protein